MNEQHILETAIKLQERLEEFLQDADLSQLLDLYEEVFGMDEIFREAEEVLNNA